MIRTVCVVGLGYVGLPTAALLARAGLRVRGADVSARAVDAVNAGTSHLVEPGLADAVSAAVASGMLAATLEPAAADAFVIAVPTPLDAEKRSDMRYVRAAAESVARVLAKGNLVVLESTSPVGSTEALAGWVAAARPDLAPGDVLFAYCPERILPGRALEELVSNARIIGGLTPEAGEAALVLYRTFVEGECALATARTAELVKLAENSYRDVNIAFANELSLVADKLGVDPWEAIRLANLHPRVDILSPGPGVGGHCLPVDPWFLVESCPDEARLIRTAREVNDAKTEWVFEQVREAVLQVLSSDPSRSMSGVSVAVLGLAYKADTDDLRVSPAVEVALKTAGLGCLVLAVEPNLTELPGKLAGSMRLCSLPDAAAADVLCVLTKHSSFAGADGRELVAKHPRVIDPVGLLRYSKTVRN
ncbi:UDP-N-acetyl-D-mannosamine dehydrogenase [Hyaloraphidium curvatum]|nr:UDP-N-acetyl-D-mannosamine dehydrogenase [Hyaloraphidium curvatum]